MFKPLLLCTEKARKTIYIHIIYALGNHISKLNVGCVCVYVPIHIVARNQADWFVISDSVTGYRHGRDEFGYRQVLHDER